MNAAVLMNRLRDAWGGLAPNERRLALIGAGVLASLLLYLILWLPLQKDLARLRTAVPEERAQLARMRNQAATIKPLRGLARGATAGGVPLTIVEQSANARGLRSAITRLEADGSTGVLLAVDGVAFNALIAWVADLQTGHALFVDNATIEAQSKPGIVNARLKLRAETP